MILGVTWPPICVIFMVTGGTGMTLIGSNTSPPIRPGPTYTGSCETSDAVTVIVVVTVVSDVDDGPLYTCAVTVYVAVTVVTSTSHSGRIKRQGGMQDTDRALGNLVLQTTSGGR